MPVSPARYAAYRTLLRVSAGRGFAVDWLHTMDVSKLKDADRRLATDIVMGVSRWRGELDYQIARLSGRKLETYDPEVAAILRMGAYQIRFLEKVPKAAVVNEAVELAKTARKRSAAGLVNAVLRKCSPPALRLGAIPFEQLNSEGREAVKRALPSWLFERWAARDWPQTGDSDDETALRLAWASAQIPRTTLAVTAANPQQREALIAELAHEGVRAVPGEFSDFALSVQSGNVLSTRAYRERRVVIQDEASQLVAELVSPVAGQRVLDLCAAPGMKAALLAWIMGRGDLVVCDLSGPRLKTVGQLLLGRIPPGFSLHAVRLDATRALPFRSYFDRILLDAPCSGTGTLARNPEIKWRLSPCDLTRYAEKQKAMLENALSHLAPGGRLVYATCSLEPEENEEVVNAILRVRHEFRKITELAQEFPSLAPLLDAEGSLRTRPDLHGMDGFYAAVLARKA